MKVIDILKILHRPRKLSWNIFLFSCICHALMRVLMFPSDACFSLFSYNWGAIVRAAHSILNCRKEPVGGWKQCTKLDATKFWYFYASLLRFLQGKFIFLFFVCLWIVCRKYGYIWLHKQICKDTYYICILMHIYAYDMYICFLTYNDLVS